MNKKVLNLYSGLGGNRKLWIGVDVTSVENNEEIADVYFDLYPQDQLVIGDAHQYLLDHFEEFDFIWSSPPCQSHSRMNRFTRHSVRRYPEMSLWQELIFLKEFCGVPWVVENVDPYYDHLIHGQRIGRHVFWSNVWFGKVDPVEPPEDFINQCDLTGKKALMDWLGIHFEKNIYYGGNHCPAQVLRNCVHPVLGKRVFDAVMAGELKQKTLFDTTPNPV